MLKRALRAALLDGRVYREIGDEPEDTFSALAVVLATAIAFALGVRSIPTPNFGDTPPLMVILVAISTIVSGWLAWTGLAFVIGTLFLRGDAGFRKLMRSIGIAYGPGILSVMATVPVAGGFLFFLSLVWLLPAGLVAIKETQGYDWIRAFISAAVGWAVAFLVLPGYMLFGAVPSS